LVSELMAIRLIWDFLAGWMAGLAKIHWSCEELFAPSGIGRNESDCYHVY
jgi:hypothetical protein